MLGLTGALAAGPALAAAPDAAALTDPAETIPLWPGTPPGARAVLPTEQIVDRVASSGFRDRYVTGVGKPMMTVFRPARPNGGAVLVIPGGGYIRVVIDKEGFETGRRLSAAGLTAFVLRYRLPGEGWDRPADIALQDAQRAMRLIRAGAAGFRIDPGRVAVLGCSAGGHVAASLCVRAFDPLYPAPDAADSQEPQPNLCALLYPVITMSPPLAHAGSRTALLGAAPTPAIEAANSPDQHVNERTPPTFLVHALDDPSVPVANSLQYLAALRSAKIPAEAHLFEEGGHGFGIYLARGKPAAAWPDLFLAWAWTHGLTGAG
jgi:acetyl esterase/lipase